MVILVLLSALGLLAQTKSVSDFAALGDGLTDDTAALQAALTWACHTAPFGNLYFPQGRYVITSQLTCALVNTGGRTINGVRLYGSGPNSVIQNRGTTNGALLITGAAVANFDDFYLSDLKIQNQTTGLGAFGFKMDGVAGFGIQNLIVEANGSLAEGVELIASQQGYMLGTVVRNAVTGIALRHRMVLNGTYDQGEDRVKLDSGMVQNSSAQAFLLESSPGVNGGNNLITNFHTDENPIGINIIGGVAALEISNIHLENNSKAGIMVRVGAAPFTNGPLTIRHNQFGEPTGNAFDITGTNINIEDNFISTTKGTSLIQAESTYVTFSGNTVYGTMSNNSTVGFLSYGNHCVTAQCPSVTKWDTAQYAPSFGIKTSVAASACGGKATLSHGRVIVSTTCPIGPDDYVLMTRQSAKGRTGELRLGTIVPGKSFKIESATTGDTSVVAWEIRHTY